MPWVARRGVEAKSFKRGAETLRLWVRRTVRDQGKRTGLTTHERERLKALERENRNFARRTRFFARRRLVLREAALAIS